MANLPPKPVFTNLGNGAPAYSSRRNSTSQPGGVGARNPHSNPRHYHPYDRPPSTPPQGSPIPPCRRDASRSRRPSDLPGPRGPHHPSHSFTNKTASPVLPPNANSSPAVVSPAYNNTSPGSNGTPWAGATYQAGYFGDNRGSNLAGSGHAGAPVPNKLTSSASPTHHHGSRSVASGGALALPPRPPRMPWDVVAARSARNASSPHQTSPTATADPSSSTGPDGSAAKTPAATAEESTSRAAGTNPPIPSHPLGPPPAAGGASHGDPDRAAPVLSSPPPSSPPTAEFPGNDSAPVFNPSPAASNSGPKSVPRGDSRGSDGDDGSPLASSHLPLPAVGAATITTITKNPLSPGADTRLVLTLGPGVRTFLASAAVLSAFGAWNLGHLHQHQEPPSAAVSHDPATHTLTVDLTRLVRPAGNLPCQELVAEQHLDALQSLLVVMHNPNDRRDLSIDDLWRLGGLKPALGLDKRWTDFLRESMGAFVKEIRNVGGWMNFNGLEEVGEDEAAVIGQSETMERAVNACLVFGWAEELRVIAARLAYVCAVEVDEGTGERVLVKPGGRRLEVRLCGRQVIDAISAAREKVVEKVFAAAEKCLGSWFTRLGHYPCRNMLCNTTRIEGLITVLRWLGLFPRVNMDRSLQELVTLLQFTTADDAELAAVAIENGWEEDFMRKRFKWPMYIRDRFGGTCNQCDEKAPTSMLLPLEDLLRDLTFEMQGQLLEYIELKSL